MRYSLAKINLLGFPVCSVIGYLCMCVCDFTSVTHDTYGPRRTGSFILAAQYYEP